MKQSRNTQIIGISLMILAALSTSFGQLFWKLSIHFFDIYFIIGFILYGTGAVVMIIAFRFGELSVLHPLMSVGYIFAIVWGGLILEETITPTILVGTILILIGSSLVGGEHHD